MVRTAYSSMRQDSVCTLIEITVSLERNSSQAYCTKSKGYNIHHLVRHVISRYIYIYLKTPQAVSISKKRKSNYVKEMVVNGRVRRRTEHFLAYISNMMDVLDTNDMKDTIWRWIMLQYILQSRYVN
jgi:hypothetical protein